MGMTKDDEAAMRLAIDASRLAMEAGDMPYGASLVSAQGMLLHVARNREMTTSDCTAHAEVVLIREARALHDPESLHGATVYASGEPCAMCSGAMYWAGVRRVVYAAPSELMARVMGGPLLPIRCADVLARASRAVLVDGPLLKDEALEVLVECAAPQLGPLVRYGSGR
jgi:tRNA(Arg) A34 adenosine deaminase TadA